MRAVDIIRKKRDGHALTHSEIETFVHGVTTRAWPDYQASALLMAIVLRGMDIEETAALTRAMVHSGSRLDLSDIPGPKVDKHSTGGVGDKTSLVVAPLAASCGVIVPMMSGRGLGHTGGTLDKLEAIPGFRVRLGVDELRAALATIGCAMIGQTSEIAPADRLLYALRDVTATVESIPLITASIMSKKIAEGIDSLVLDVKCGLGAFMKLRADAEELAQALVRTGQDNGVRTEAVLSAMDAPLGLAIGNALEVRECLQTLRGHGPCDLKELSIDLASRMVALGKRTSLGEAKTEVCDALDSGRGVEKLRRIIAQQGGDPHVVDDPERLPLASGQCLLRADRSGYVAGIHAGKAGMAAMLLGAGREHVDSAIDPAVGVIVKARLGERLRAGDALAEVHYRDTGRLDEALSLLRDAWKISDDTPPPAPLILASVTA